MLNAMDYPRDSNMVKNPPTNPVFLLFFLLFKIIPELAMAQINTTIFPINVGVVLDLDTPFGKMGLTCINMALSDFYASHAHYNTRLVLHTRDSTRDVVVAAAAGDLFLFFMFCFCFIQLLFLLLVRSQFHVLHVDVILQTGLDLGFASFSPFPPFFFFFLSFARKLLLVEFSFASPNSS